MAPLFTTRDDLRSKLRDLLVDEVRQGAVDGDRAKLIAGDIIDELELSPDDEAPLAIFERLHDRYPQELSSLKAKLDRAQNEQRDQDMARAMAEQIALGNFEGAVALSRGQALETLAAAAPPVEVPAVEVPTVEAPAAAPEPASAPAAAAAATPAATPLRAALGGALRRASDALAKAAASIAPPAPRP